MNKSVDHKKKQDAQLTKWEHGKTSQGFGDEGRMFIETTGSTRAETGGAVESVGRSWRMRIRFEDVPASVAAQIIAEIPSCRYEATAQRVLCPFHWK